MQVKKIEEYLVKELTKDNTRDLKEGSDDIVLQVKKIEESLVKKLTKDNTRDLKEGSDDIKIKWKAQNISLKLKEK